MAEISVRPPVKLFVGFIFKDDKSLQKAETHLMRRFGVFDFKSPRLQFTFTDYYRQELGENLSRAFVSFRKLIDPSELARIKTFTNSLEKKLSRGNKRLINIDPGYLELSKLILATTKDYCHRIYLKNGIYGEVTLMYQNRQFAPQPWTYPDYKTTEYRQIFEAIRSLYAVQIKPHER